MRDWVWGIGQVDQLTALLDSRFDLPGTVLRDTIMQELTLRPGLADGEVADDLREVAQAR